MGNGSSGRLNVILHGLLFLELNQKGKTDVLEITAPDLTSSNHHLYMGVSGNLANIDYQTIHWETETTGIVGAPHGKIINGIPYDVPDSVYQFNRTPTEVGNIDKNGIQGKIFLPWPQGWLSIRTDAIPALKTRLPYKDPLKQVHTHIEQLCGKKIGVATVLIYAYPSNLPPIPGWSPTQNVEIYFQPDAPETIDGVNSDLRNASANLFSSDNFDLKIDAPGGSPGASTPIGGTYPPNSGISVGDEISLNEHVTPVKPEALRPKSVECLQNLETDLDAQLRGLNLSEKSGLPRALSIVMASPANCPMFFLG